MVDSPHVFFCAGVDEAMCVIISEIAISIMPVTANNRTGFDVFMDNRLQRGLGFVRYGTRDHTPVTFDHAEHGSFV